MITTVSTSTTITVRWDPVDCINQNGRITRYLVRYAEVETVEGSRTVSVSGSATETTISGLTPSTEYTIEVAAVNSVSTGPYSDARVVLTESMYNV